MRGKKTRDEDIEAVKIAKITDPQKSLRDIEKETWVNYVTVSDIIDEEYKNNPEFRAFIDNSNNYRKDHKNKMNWWTKYRLWTIIWIPRIYLMSKTS